MVKGLFGIYLFSFQTPYFFIYKQFLFLKLFFLFFIEQAFFYLTREMKEVILSILKRELLKAMEFEGD